MTVKISQKAYPEEELQIMKKCESKFLVKLLDSFSFEMPFIGNIHCIAMDYYEVRKMFI